MEGISNLTAYIKNEQEARELTEKFSGMTAEASARSKSAVSKARLEAIKGKMRRGNRLSYSDKSFLRKNSPQLLHRAVAAERKQEEMEQRLRRCKSKDEFTRLRTRVTQMASGSPAALGGEIAGTAAQAGSALQPSCQAEPSFAQTTTVAETTAAGENGGQIAAREDTSSLPDTQKGRFTPSDRGDGVNYSYRAVDFAYRKFKQGMRYARLPQTDREARRKHFSIRT